MHVVLLLLLLWLLVVVALFVCSSVDLFVSLSACVVCLIVVVMSQDCELLGLDPVNGRPERLILTRLLVPPVCIRPSVRMDAAGTYAVAFLFSVYLFV